MSYVKAQEVLPAQLLQEIQNHVDGKYLYIPKKEENRKKWGDGTSARQEIGSRNALIYAEYRQGATAGQLAEQYYLTEKSIRRIIAGQKKQEAQSE